MIMIRYDQTLLGVVVKMREVVVAGDVTITVDVKVAGDSVAGVEYATIDVNIYI